MAWERFGRGKLLLCCRLLGGARRFGVHGEERGGAYRGGRPPTACSGCVNVMGFFINPPSAWPL